MTGPDESSPAPGSIRDRSVHTYYETRLAAERLRMCYELAPPPVLDYLNGEIEHAVGKVERGSSVLELGCGYGRVLRALAGSARAITGIDTSMHSLALARVELGDHREIRLLAMNAASMGFRGRVFDLTICIQNGISAFGVDRLSLVREAIRVTRSGGIVLFSSYAASFWDERLAWFRLQARHGLIGKIDEDATGSGVIVCEDGFRATTVGEVEFRSLAARLNVAAKIDEVRRSSLVCEIAVP